MPKITRLGYLPAYGTESSHGFTREFDRRISVQFDEHRLFDGYDYRVLVQCEPPVLYRDFYGYVCEIKHQFDLILAYDERILQFPNAEKFIPVGTWLPECNIDKTNQITFITSSKMFTRDHVIRKQIFKLISELSSINDLSTLFHRSPPFEPNRERYFANAMFNIVCENQYMNDMFTEKLIDCLRSKTVPVFFGCPNIGEYFDERGIIKFSNIEEFKLIITDLNSETYQSMKPYIDRNYELSKPYWQKTVYERIEDIIEGKISK